MCRRARLGGVPLDYGEVTRPELGDSRGFAGIMRIQMPRVRIMAGAFVSSAIFVGASELIRAHGQQPASVARAAGVPAAALENADLPVSASAVVQFFERAATVCQDPGWGLELSLNARLAAVIGPLWILLRNARTVREMCVEIAGNFDLYSSAAMVNFERMPDGNGLLRWSPSVRIQGAVVQMAEFALALLCRELRTHAPVGWMPQMVLFQHAAPVDLSLHRRLFGSGLRFDQDCNALFLDRAALDQPLQSGTTLARGTVRGILRHAAGLADTDTPQQVESIIRSQLPFGPCNLRAISLAMGLAPRTLQEHLKRHGTGFHAIHDKVRADLALKYVRDSRLGAARIAEILGYMDATTLSRSFRRWHGRSMREMRRQWADCRHADQCHGGNTG